MQVCLRGPANFAGYYKQPEMTADTIDKDGFFHTGMLNFSMCHVAINHNGMGSSITAAGCGGH